VHSVSTNGEAPADAYAGHRAHYPRRVDVARSPVPLWLSELLEDPSLGASVAAGHAGIDRRGPIRWAHISELPDPTPWLEGGELLLTTGLGILDSDELQRRFVAGVADRGVVAIGFAMGVSADAVPSGMLAACDELEVPLFTVPYEIPFIAISRRVAHHAFEEHYATLRRAVDLHRQVLASVVGDAGVDGVLATVGRAMPDAALVAFDFAGVEVARIDPRGLTDGLDPARLWAQLPRGRTRATGQVAGRAVTSSSIVVGDQLEAVVVAVSEAPLLEHEELLFEQGVAGVSLELARHRSVREARRARIDELFEEIAAGRTNSATIARALERVGATPTDTFRVLAVAMHGVATDALCSLVEDALLGTCTPIVGRSSGSVHALVPDEAPAAECIVAAAERRGWKELAIGRSRAKSELDALRAAMREAGVALNLETSGPIRDVDGLGLPGLLAGIRDDLGAADFVAQVLGPVLEHDARESAHLVDSLRAYLAHGCRPGPAADELCIHRHTLAYRLERIHELTGRDPRAGEHLVSFGLALELLGRVEAS
jgi:PucR family transcriptional regulator, purine catabolism regulatory protein